MKSRKSMLKMLAMLTLATLSTTLAEPPASPPDATPAFYDPIEKNVEGWTIAMDPQLLNDENRELGERALKALANHLQRVAYIVDKDRLTTLKKMRIWIDLEHSLDNLQYHPDRGWLIAHGHDPRLEKHIHIPRARQLLDPRQWSKHPYCVLHELAHAYHDQVLRFDEKEILAAYQASKQAGIYEKVLLHTGQYARHYGMNNHHEYFAESTESYFGVNDFYPFVRAELKEHDPRMHELLQKVWGHVP